MNKLLWTLQILAALLYLASGVMKAFRLEQIREGVRSFDALPDKLWAFLGLMELVCALGLILPPLLHFHPALTILSATILAMESLIFIGVHLKYRELAPTIMSVALGLFVAFIAYGRLFLKPIL